jgi:hypothetical protein
MPEQIGRGVKLVHSILECVHAKWNLANILHSNKSQKNYFPADHFFCFVLNNHNQDSV